jgi:hypothetical protein
VFASCVRIAPLLGLGLAVASSEVLAGAWTAPQGHGQVIVTGTASRAERAFDGDWSSVPTPRTNKFELQGLIEYGVTDLITAILAPGYQRIDIGAPTDAQRSGLGYSELGGRVLLLQGSSWVFSGQTLVRLPGTSQFSNPAAIGYTDSEVDVRALFGASFSLGTWPAFIDMQAAQRFRAGAAPDEFRADLTFGIRPLPQWLLLAQSFNVFSEGSGVPLFPSYEYHKLQLSVVHDITPHWSLQLGGFSAYAGRNALQENGAILGVWYRF